MLCDFVPHGNLICVSLIPVHLRYLFLDGGRVGTQSAFMQLFKAVESGPYSKHTFVLSYAEDSVKDHRKACALIFLHL